MFLHYTATVVIALLLHFLVEENTVLQPNVYWQFTMCQALCYIRRVQHSPHSHTTLWRSSLQLGSVSDLKNLPKVTELFSRTNRIEERLNHLAVSLPIQAPKGTTSVCKWGLSNHEHLLVILRVVTLWFTVCLNMEVKQHQARTRCIWQFIFRALASRYPVIIILQNQTRSLL